MKTLKHYLVIAGLLLGMASTTKAELITDTLYVNSFVGSGEVINSGTPETALTTNHINNGTSADAKTPTSSAEGLKIGNKKGDGAKGINMVIGSLTYAEPFNPILSENSADSIVWMFNMRYNYQNSLSGFGSGKRGLAAILVSDSEDFLSGNGYALVNNGEADPKKRYRLVSFTNGLSNNDNLGELIVGQTLTNTKCYMSFKIVYIPQTNTWKLYDRVDSDDNGFADPTQGVYNFCGEVIDNTHTANTNSHFGFLNNYYGNIDLNCIVKNYTVVAYTTPSDPTSITAAQDANYRIANVQNGINVRCDAANVRIFNALGKIMQQKQVFSNHTFTVPAGVYFVQITSNNAIHTQKVVVK